MQTKFETKSKRVKGLSFHRYRPWILASLHNGSIHMFDYRAQVLLDKYEDHNGPVRGIHFHDTQPMFVSGGDDQLIKVWNYKVKKCLFTLTGHMDYVRTVQFHCDLPWIVSASDDQTVRVWNWQNRSQIAILTGHSHYVMCATFHHEDTLIASCSLDHTIRVWDFFRLKEMSMQKSKPGEIISGMEVEVKHILEDHEKGVNWVTFHPTLKVLASGADDKQIKLWRLSGNKHWAMDSLKGHTGNVSCVLFHPRMEILLSNSEDRTMRIWDMQRRVQIHQARKETDRYWIMAAHPTLNYFAAGYDNGMNVFKLEKERYASVRVGSSVFFVKAKQLLLYDLSAKTKATLAPVTIQGKSVLLNQPSQIQYNAFNQAGHDLLLTFEAEGGQALLMSFAKDLSQARCTFEQRFDNTLAAIFISKDRVCTLDTNREITVSSFDSKNARKWPILKKGLTKVDNIFPAPLGKILVAADDTLFLYDLSAKRVNQELSVNEVRRVHWNTSFSHCVVVTKNSIMVLNKNLQVINSQRESSKIKAGCFDENNSFVYSTSTHIKYMFLEGKTTGTFRSIEEPVYVAFFMKNILFALTRQGEMEVYTVENTDYLFKLALHEKNLVKVKEILSQGKLCGRSIICYLKEQGYSEIALFFEKDTKQRYNLAVSSGNIQVALEAALELKEPTLFDKLSQTTMSLGNYPITERCLRENKAFDKLNFFYALSGSVARLEKMEKMVVPNLGDPMLKFNTSILTGNVEERVMTLVETGQLPLAYMTARAHDLSEQLEYIETQIMESDKYDLTTIMDQTEKYLARSKALVPCRPVHLNDGESYMAQWPMTNLRAKEAEKAAQMFERQKQMEAQNDDRFFEASAFGGSTNKEVANILEASSAPKTTTAATTASAAQNKINLADAAWGDDESDIDIDEDETAPVAENLPDTTEESSDIFVPPPPGQDPYTAALAKNPSNVALNVACGEFTKALESLKRQICLKNAAPLKQFFVDGYTLNRARLQTLPQGPDLTLQLKTSQSLPFLPMTVASLAEKINTGLSFTTKGEFEASLAAFRGCLQSATMLAVSSAAEVEQVKQLIARAVEYIVALRLELERGELEKNGGDLVRQLECICYNSLCGMETAHKYLFYKRAFKVCYKAKNYITSAHFARQVIELEPTGLVTADVIQQYKKYYQSCQSKGSNAVKLAFEPQDSVQVTSIMAGYLCAGSLSLLTDSRSVATVRCPLDGAIFSRDFAGKVCEVCQLCALGQDSLGLNILLQLDQTEVPRTAAAAVAGSSADDLFL